MYSRRDEPFLAATSPVVCYGEKGSQLQSEDGKAGNMIHYHYATRGGYLYLLGRSNNKPKVEKVDEFVLSVPDKTPQISIDSLAHRRFMQHLRRPRKVAHERHHRAQERELVTV